MINLNKLINYTLGGYIMMTCSYYLLCIVFMHPYGDFYTFLFIFTSFCGILTGASFAFGVYRLLVMPFIVIEFLVCEGWILNCLSVYFQTGSFNTIDHSITSVVYDLLSCSMGMLVSAWWLYRGYVGCKK